MEGIAVMWTAVGGLHTWFYVISVDSLTIAMSGV